MEGGTSAKIGRDAVGNVVTSGNENQVNAKIAAKLVKTMLPAARSVDVVQELVQIRAILDRVGGEHTGKIGRAVDDAVEEAKKREPNKDEIGGALNRAIEYAKKSSGFAEEVENLVPHLTKAVA